MDISFTQALRELGPDFAIRLANDVPSKPSVFDELLPDRNVNSYVAEAASMTIRSTMAGLVPMDSPLPPTGNAEGRQFMEKIAKIGNKVVFSEQAQRELQAEIIRLQLAGGGSTLQTMIGEVLNFTNKLIIQPHRDTRRYMKAVALTTGKLEWAFNRVTLDVDYGVPAGHILPRLTGADAFTGTSSKFWETTLSARRLLRYDLRTVLAHPETIDAIVSNDANRVDVITQSESVWQIRQYRGTLERPQTDARYTINLVAVDEEAEIINPANPDETLILPLMPFGKMVFVGNNTRSGYRVGEGSTPNPEADRALGYGHVGPTVEGQGRVGLDVKVYIPQEEDYQLRGKGVQNYLPVLEAPHKLVIADSELS